VQLVNGLVVMNGRVIRVSGAGTVVGVIPAGHCPPYTIFTWLANYNAAGTAAPGIECLMSIDPNGTITVTPLTAIQNGIHVFYPYVVMPKGG
jgi:hypothetical protein